jgi:type VI secretion system protein
MPFHSGLRFGGTRRAMALLAFLFSLLLAAAPLTGCGVLASVSAGTRALVGLDPSPVKPDWESLTFAAASDANANSALAVDVVLVKDKALLENLSTMSAVRYFAARSDLRRTFPDALTVLAVEITPGQVIRFDGKRFGRERAWAALAFANYASPGEHRTRLELNNNGYLLQLNAQGFVASDIGTGAAR